MGIGPVVQSLVPIKEGLLLGPLTEVLHVVKQLPDIMCQSARFRPLFNAHSHVPMVPASLEVDGLESFWIKTSNLLCDVSRPSLKSPIVSLNSRLACVCRAAHYIELLKSMGWQIGLLNIIQSFAQWMRLNGLRGHLNGRIGLWNSEKKLYDQMSVQWSVRLTKLEYECSVRLRINERKKHIQLTFKKKEVSVMI